MVELTNKMIADSIIQKGKRQNFKFIVITIMQFILTINMILMPANVLFEVLGYSMLFSICATATMWFKSYRDVTEDLRNNRLKVVESICRGKEHEDFVFYLRMDGCEEKVMVPEEFYKDTSLGDSIYLVYLGDRPDVLNMYSGNNYKYVG